MIDSIIQTTELTKFFRKKAALTGLSFTVTGSGLIGLIGRNGSGKTTLMKLLAGQLEVTSGKLEILGEDPMDNLGVLSNVVYTFSNMEYDKHLRLGEILHNYFVMFPHFDLNFASGLLKYFDLNPRLKYKNLSHGMASIFNFICGLSCRARITLLDEPVLGMDVTVRKAVYDILLREFSEYPRTIIISSHILSELEPMLSDILLIDGGELVLFRNIDDLRQSAYRIVGDESTIDKFSAGKNILSKKTGLTSEAIIFETMDPHTLESAKQSGLSVSAVRPEELYIYLTKENKEGDLECLWQKAN